MSYLEAEMVMLFVMYYKCWWPVLWFGVLCCAAERMPIISSHTAELLTETGIGLSGALKLL
jgi:hypothetical protein